jgi:hypothetical protein
VLFILILIFILICLFHVLQEVLFVLVERLVFGMGYVLPEGLLSRLASAIGLRLTFPNAGVYWETLDCGHFAAVSQLLLNLLFALVAWVVLLEVALRGTGRLRGLLDVRMTERIGKVIKLN